MFAYRELTVEDALRFYIKKIWILDNSQNAQAENDKSILPNGCFNIAFITGEGAVTQHHTAQNVLKAGIYFCGQATQAVQVSILPYTKVNLVQLYAWTPAQLIPESMEAYTDTIAPIGKVLPHFEAAAQHIAHADEAQVRDFLTEKFTSFLYENTDMPLLYNSLYLLLSRQGNITIQSLCEQLHCSTRHLQKLFLKYVGITPKEFAIIIKLRNAVDEIAYPLPTADSSLTRLALDCEFYDQAHFIHTFKSIVNTSPKKFIPTQYLLSFKE